MVFVAHRQVGGIVEAIPDAERPGSAMRWQCRSPGSADPGGLRGFVGSPANETAESRFQRRPTPRREPNLPLWSSPTRSLGCSEAHALLYASSAASSARSSFESRCSSALTVSLRLSRRAAEGPRENRIRGVGSIRYPGPLLFSGNVATEQLDDAIEVADHLPDRHSLPMRGFASIKMTLVSHGLLQNDPDSQQRREHHGF